MCLAQGHNTLTLMSLELHVPSPMLYQLSHCALPFTNELIVYVQRLKADIANGAWGLIFGLSLHLHPYLYIQAVKTLASHLGKYQILLHVYFHTSETSARISQGCGNHNIWYLLKFLKDKQMAIIYLSKQHFTSPKEQIVHKELSLDLTVLKVRYHK